MADTPQRQGGKLQYLVRRVQTPDWQTVPAVELRHTGWLPPCPISARGQACHDGHTLFLRMEAREAVPRATLTGPLEQVCDDSCLEFFIAPAPGDARYLNFECNPLGTLYLGFGALRATRVRQIVRDPGMFQIHPFPLEGGWGVTLAIPGDFIRVYLPEFDFSGEAAGNFYKCGDKTATPHYLAWSPLSCDTPDFHRRQDFGTLVFETADTCPR